MKNKEEFKAQLMEKVTPLITSTVTSALFAVLEGAIKQVAITNMTKEDLKGKTEMHPTKDESNLSENERAASKTSSNMANDEVNIQEGSVEASETEATASTSEATASEAGASASRAKAGASDIETKALKVM